MSASQSLHQPASQSVLGPDPPCAPHFSLSLPFFPLLNPSPSQPSHLPTSSTSIPRKTPHVREYMCTQQLRARKASRRSVIRQTNDHDHDYDHDHDHDHEEDYCETIIYLSSTFVNRGFVDDVPPNHQNAEIILCYHPRYVVVHERDIHITNFSRRTPASRGNRAGILDNKKAKRNPRDGSDLRLVVFHGGRETTSETGEERREGGKGDKREETSAADRDGVDVQVIIRYINPYNAKLTREKKEIFQNEKKKGGGRSSSSLTDDRRFFDHTLEINEADECSSSLQRYSWMPPALGVSFP